VSQFPVRSFQWVTMAMKSTDVVPDQVRDVLGFSVHVPSVA